MPSNDPLEPARTVVVRGRMAGGLVAHPEAVHISGLTLGEEWTRVLTVACTDSEAQFEITSVRCDLPDCEMTGPLPVIDRPSHEGLAFQFDVLQMPRSVGKSVGHIVVQTNHSRYKTIRIPVDVEVRSQMTMNLPSLLFDLARSPSPQKVSVTSVKALRLSAADSGIYDIALAEDPISTGWIVTVGLKPQIKVQSVLKSEIRLNVSGLDGEQMLRIPVSIVPAVMSGPG